MPSTLDGLRRQLETEMRFRVERANSRMTDELKRTAPVATGELRRKTGVALTSQTSTEIRSVAEIDTAYAESVTMGTRPHVIRPRTARVLRFTVGGKTVFAAKVNHPGTDPNPFFDRVIDRWADYLQSS